MSWRTDKPDYYTTREIAARYRRSPRTVEYWRQIGYGPPWIRVGRQALYPVADVEAYDARLRKTA